MPNTNINHVDNHVDKNKIAKRRGILFIISAPSGAGKTSLVRALVKRAENMTVSISCTTRAKRDSEKDGESYYYVDKGEFMRMAENDEFLEYANVFGNYYGTPKKNIVNYLKNGIDVALAIDWQGERDIKKRMTKDCVSIFVLPPSKHELRSRLENRNQDDQSVIEKRLNFVKEEILHCKNFDYVIVNDSFEEACKDLCSIVRSESLKSKLQINRYADLLNKLIE